VKDGKRYDYERAIQRYLCLWCGLRFNGKSLKLIKKRNVVKDSVSLHSGSNLADCSVGQGKFAVKAFADKGSFTCCEDVGSHATTIVGKDLSALCSYNSRHRVGATQRSVKNLETPANVQTVAGETERDIKGSLTLFAAKQLTTGLTEDTIKRRLQNLDAIQKLGGNLNEPLSVWKAIESSTRRDIDQPWTEGSKRLAAQAYIAFAKTLHITIPEDLNFGKWKVRQKLPWLPLTNEVDQLVAA
jgi:hypothetical protein